MAMLLLIYTKIYIDYNIKWHRIYFCGKVTSKKEGKTMQEMKINLSLKYWSKHKKRAFSIIYAIAVSMAALTCATFLARSSSVAYYESQLDISGSYDVILPDIVAGQIAYYINDNRFSDIGTLYRGGTVSSPNGTEFCFGALDGPATGLYHSTPEEGRYPEKSGEITAYRSFFEANGCYPGIGSSLSLALYDKDGLFFKEYEFTVVGILNDNNNRLLVEKDDYVFPQVFLSLEDIPQNSSQDLLANYALSANISQIKEEFIKRKIDFYDGSRIIMMNTMALVPITGISEKNLYESLGSAHKDFYAYALIPVFSLVVLLVAFVSICNAVSTSLSERKHQSAMLRCIGMSNGKVMKMALAESLCMVFAGTGIGFILGIAVYALILKVQDVFLNLNVYPAFSVNPVIEATTINPYLFPATACFICSFFAIIIPYLVQLHKSPTEGLHSSVPAVQKRILRIKNKPAILGKLSGGFYQNISLLIIVITVTWSSVFGYSYFSAQSGINKETYRKMLENSKLMGFDYFAERNFDTANCGNAQLNKHGSGISPELAEKIATCNYVKSFHACIEAGSTKVVFQANELNDETFMALSPVNIENNVQEGLEELHKKSLNTQGYTSNEILFNIPSIGVPDKELRLLSKYVTDGSINMEKLRSGEEVLILRTTGTSPFTVGQTLSMTDVVIDNPKIEEYGFTTGHIPDGYEPDFYYDYTDNADMTNIPGYAFGSRCNYKVTVGGYIDIHDKNIAQFFQTQGLTGDCGFNILCSENAFSKWGLPDRNYTKLGVKLKEHVSVTDFEKLWYNVMGNSKDISSTSQASITRHMDNVETTNMSIFFSIIIVVVILGLIGMSNSASLRVRRQLRTYSVLRAIGCSKAGLVFIILRQGLVYVLAGTITSFIPLWIFELFRKRAIRYNVSHVYALMPENGRFNIPWQSLFPTRIELFSQPLILVVITVFLTVCFIMVISNVIPAVWVVKKNITEALENDSF